MKQLMIDMMAAMMPYMKTPVLIGGALVVVGAVLTLWRLKSGRGPVGVVGWILVGLGAFYIICQGMGLYLGMQPTVNFGDPTKFEFKTVEFWKIGLALLAPGALFLFVAKSR